VTNKIESSSAPPPPDILEKFATKTAGAEVNGYRRRRDVYIYIVVRGTGGGIGEECRRRFSQRAYR